MVIKPIVVPHNCLLDLESSSNTYFLLTYYYSSTCFGVIFKVAPQDQILPQRSFLAKNFRNGMVITNLTTIIGIHTFLKGTSGAEW